MVPAVEDVAAWVLVEKDWARWHAEHPYAAHPRKKKPKTPSGRHAASKPTLGSKSPGAGKGVKITEPKAARKHLEKLNDHLLRGHAALQAGKYGATLASLQEFHDQVSELGNITGPPGSNPHGNFLGGVEFAASQVQAAIPLVQQLVQNPQLQDLIHQITLHLISAQQFLNAAAQVLQTLGFIAKEESSMPGVPTVCDIAAWLQKAYQGKGTPAGQARAMPLAEYWTHGEGGAKIRWGTPGDFDRCVRLVEKHMPGRAQGYCNLRHHEALGIYPATHAKLDRAGKGAIPVKKDWAEWDAAHKGGKTVAATVRSVHGTLNAKHFPSKKAYDPGFRVHEDLNSGRILVHHIGDSAVTPAARASKLDQYQKTLEAKGFQTTRHPGGKPHGEYLQVHGKITKAEGREDFIREQARRQLAQEVS